MKVVFRHFFVALLPLVFGLAASWGFAFSQNTCGRLVGPVFAPKPKCKRRSFCER